MLILPFNNTNWFRVSSEATSLDNIYNNINKSQADKSQADKSQANKSQANKSQENKSQEVQPQ